MKNCAMCKSEFPKIVILNGRKRNLQRRKYCLNCSPFGSHNTAKLELLQGRKRGERKRGDTYKYQKKRGLERKIELVNLMGGCCQSCGYKKNLGALEFHHIDPKTKMGKLDIRTLTNSKWSYVLSESKKCKLLCSNCHAEEHYPNLENWGH